MSAIPTKFEDLFTNISPEAVQWIQDKINAVHFCRCEGFDERDLVELRTLQFLEDPKTKDELVLRDHIAMRWSLGCFIAIYHEVPFLCLIPKQLALAWQGGSSTRMSLMKLNEMYEKNGFKRCGRKLSRTVLHETVFKYYGDDVLNEIKVRHIPKHMKTLNDPIAHITTRLNK